MAMPAPDFEPFRMSIEDILTRRYYQVPRFQRPYSWDRTNVDEFWRDSIEENDPGYFIGPMIGYRKTDDSPFVAIVDGQQRLTTITILLAAIRDALNELGDQKLATGVHRFIERPNRDDELTFVVQPEDRSPFLNLGILNFVPDRTAKPVGAGEEALQSARRILSEKIVIALRGDASTPSRARKITILKKLRDRILSLRVIWIDHGNEDDAYVVFETLNSRGKDLAVADLLKNWLLSRIRTRNNAADAAREKWNEILSVLHDSDTKIDPDRFILHWWLSREEYVGSKRLYQNIRKSVRSRADAETKLTSLVSDARLYRVIKEPSSRTWANEELQIRESLSALITLDILQPAPLLLALLRARAENKPRINQINLTLGAIEAFHFRSTVISGQSSSGGISERYAKYARLLTNASTADQRAKALKEFRDAMEASLATDELFLESFGERLVFTNEVTRDKKLVFYVLRKIHEMESSHVPKKPSVEHLMAQDQITSKGSLRLIGGIGNLLWVDEDLNQKLGDKSFKEKKKILSKHRHSYAFDDILACDEWDAAAIRAREQRLANLALSKVWKM